MSIGFTVDTFLDLASLPEAMASKNLYSGAASEGGSESAPRITETSGGFTRIEERETQDVSWGPKGTLGISSLPYDYAAALADREVGYYVTSNRVMSQDDAAQRLIGLMNHCGVQAQSDGVQLAFHRAILLAHAKNSASVIQPGRAEIRVRGGAPINFYTDIVQFLGDDTRRFFRAYADLTRAEVRRVYARHAQGDYSVAEDIRDLDWVAAERGLSRFKDLVADSSDACTNLTRPERAALGMAKQSIFSSTDNVADVVNTYHTRSQQPTINRRNVEAPRVEGPDY